MQVDRRRDICGSEIEGNLARIIGRRRAHKDNGATWANRMNDVIGLCAHNGELMLCLKASAQDLGNSSLRVIPCVVKLTKWDWRGVCVCDKAADANGER